MVSSLGVLLLLGASCSKENNVATNNTTIGDVCGPKVACADGSCAFGYCRATCEDDSDCANSGVCLSDGQTKGCRLPFEAECSASEPCPAGLTCATDDSCRTPCDDERICDVEGQVCVDDTCVAMSSGGSGGTGGSGNAGSGGKAQGGTGGTGNTSGTGGDMTEGGMAGAAPEPTEAGAGGMPPAVDCGSLDQACCAAGPECAAGQGLVCNGQDTCACDIDFDDCENGAADGCEASLSDSPDHCGVCGRDCAGGGCIAKVCQQYELVASGTGEGESFHGSWDPAGGYLRSFRPFDANGFALPSTHQPSQEVRMRAFDQDGAPGAFLTTTPIAIAFGPWITSSGVFWVEATDATLLRRVARSGGAITTPVDAVTSLYVRIDGNDLYYLDGTTLFRIPGGSLTPETVSTTMNGLINYAVVGDEIFGVNGSRQLMRGSDTVAMALEYGAMIPGDCSGNGIAADATSVFMYGSCTNDKGFVIRYDYNSTPQDGTREVIVDHMVTTDVRLVTSLAIVGQSIYFVDNGGPTYELYKMDRDGGTPQLILGNGPFYGLAVSGDLLYSWGGSPNPVDGLMRIKL